jgi:hypothetical protein
MPRQARRNWERPSEKKRRVSLRYPRTLTSPKITPRGCYYVRGRSVSYCLGRKRVSSTRHCNIDFAHDGTSSPACPMFQLLLHGSARTRAVVTAKRLLPSRHRRQSERRKGASPKARLA